ncbi:MarR family winged helix-turn-helix transcriptional regulator [Williamsia herbipolensis]|uniref:MarR family transcriptional regulator n=1 Tax=Williamsia herbipolensis TaxID=1603258 RepID=A0AAU4JZF0_9NOCA|nr:MarR family transcriptional regulator [Williamsia herbipolensis]MCX6469008.1 MarR family transcriptional regulator [Mycobacteriales bacterium]
MTETQWLTADEQRMWRAYLDSMRMLVTRLDQQLARDAGISLTDYELLVTLSEAPERRMRMSMLATAVTATRSGVTRAINRLVESGWVERVPCPDDRRGALAVLTDAGAAKLADASPGHVAEVRTNVFDVLSPRDVERLTSTYSEMRSHMSETAPRR